MSIDRIKALVAVCLPVATGTWPFWPGGLPSAAAQEAPQFYYGPHMWGGGWSTFFGPLWALLFLGAIVTLVVLIVRWLGGGTAGNLPRTETKTPHEILRERFARGEIDKAEFDDRKRALDA